MSVKKMSGEGETVKNPPEEVNDKNMDTSKESTPNSKDLKNDSPPEQANKKDDVESTPKSQDKLEEPKHEAEDKANNEIMDDKKTDSTKKEDVLVETKGTAKETEESEDGSEKSDAKVPLLDQPLEKSGKRDRKNVQRFNEEPKDEPKDGKSETNGGGMTLGSIPRVDACISRFKNDDLKLLHRLLYDSPGKNPVIKKNIRKFNGFAFKKVSEEYDKKLSALQKYEVKHLKSVCEMLDLQKTGVKDEMAERIMEFLLEPKDSGKAVSAGGRPKRTAAVRANNRGYSSHDNYSSDERHSGRSSRDKGRRANLKEDSSSHSDEDFEPSDEGSDEKPTVTKRKSVRRKFDSDDEEISDVESPSSEDSDFQEEPKNKRKRVTKVANAPATRGRGGGRRGRKPTVAPATAKKNTRGRRRNKETSEEEEEEEEEESDHKEEEDGSSSEDEPLVKKAKTALPPTDDEIKSYVKEILEGANLEQITMKTVCQQVYAHYPDFDLAHKKDFIKTTVKSLIST